MQFSFQRLKSRATWRRFFSTAQYAKGKLAVRDRINLLLDAGSFTEIDAHVVHQCHDFGMQAKKIPGDGLVCGFGQVAGQDVAVYSQDFDVFGGSLSSSNARKICKVYKRAIELRIPIVGIHDSGGARIQEGVDALVGYAEIFNKNVQASRIIPQFAAIVGPCAGGAVYSPALMDFVFVVRHTAQMFLTGPDVVAAVTNERVSAEELGGARVHSEISGVAHAVYDDEVALFEQMRLFLSYAACKHRNAPAKHWEYDDEKSAAVQRLVPRCEDAPYDVRLLIGALADDRSFFEVMALHAPNIVVGFATFEGVVCGIVANQPAVFGGAIDSAASVKGARFVDYCGAFGIPLLSLVDVPGFLPSVAQEHGGIIRHGAAFLRAYAQSTSPKMAIVVRKAYGGAFCLMAATRALTGSGVCYAWPSAQIAVMGAEAAVNVLHRKQKLTAQAHSAAVAAYKETFENPLQAASKGHVDAIIEPWQTRAAILTHLKLMERNPPNCR